VSRLERIPRKGEYLATFSDGTQVRILKDHLAETGIEEGVTMGRQRIAELGAAYDYARAREGALRLLRVRPRTELELRRRLGVRWPGPGTVGRVVADLRSEGLIDDRVFARLWVREKLQRGDCGRMRIRHDLEAKGIDREVIAEELDRSYSRAEEVRVAAALAMKKMRRLSDTPAGETVRKVYAYLLRKGFDSDAAAQAARQAAVPAGRTDDDDM
jgi:regulatory protein